MAGDRRATEGVSIAYRNMEKVFPADRFSAVAIAGAAGPAVEMVKLFQTQLEHYEKVEGAVLTLEGKANQLSQMIRANMPMAMQGLAVVPLFAGWTIAGGREGSSPMTSPADGMRRRTSRPPDPAVATRRRPSSSVFATTSLATKPWSSRLTRCTRPPTRTRRPAGRTRFGYLPIIATVDVTGFTRLAEEEVAARFAAVLARGGRPGGSYQS